MVRERLIQIGLSDHEASVYSFLLEHGACTVKKIHAEVGIHRVSTYPILESLIKKGLVSTTDAPKKKLFMPESPERLLDLLENKRINLEEAKNNVEENKKRLQMWLPEMKLIHASIKEKPKVRFFEGKESLQTLQSEFLEEARRSGEPIYEIFSEDETIKLLQNTGLDLERRQKMNQMLLKANITIHCLYTTSQPPTFMSQDFYNNSMALHYVPKDLFPIHADITVCGNKTSMTSSAAGSGIFSVIIDSVEISTTIKSLFQMSLNYAKNMYPPKQAVGDEQAISIQ